MTISETINAYELIPTVIAFISFCIGLFGLWASVGDMIFLRSANIGGVRHSVASDNLRNQFFRLIIKLTLIGTGFYVMDLPPANPDLPTPPALWGYAVQGVVTSVMLASITISELLVRRHFVSEALRNHGNDDRRQALRRDEDLERIEAAGEMVRKILREELAKLGLQRVIEQSEPLETESQDDVFDSHSLDVAQRPQTDQTTA